MVQKDAIMLWVQGWASPWDDWKTLSVNPAVKGTFFELGKDKEAKKERDGSTFHLLCQLQ